jgi:hypothetical protein
MLPMLVFSLMTWRCPVCNTLLVETSNPSFCYRCRAQLRKNVKVRIPDLKREKTKFFTFDREMSKYELQEAKPAVIILIVGVILGFLIALLKT